MQTDSMILLATSQESLRTNLSHALQEVGFQVFLAHDLESCLAASQGAGSQYLILDAAWIPDGFTELDDDSRAMIRSLDGNCMVLYNPESGFGFESARRAGVTEFVAYPAPSELVVGLIESARGSSGFSQGAVQSPASDQETFLSLKDFEVHVDACISKARAKDDKVAVLCLNMLAPFQSEEVPEPEAAKKRRLLENWFRDTLVERMVKFTQENPGMGVVPQNLRWAWARHDRALLVLPDLRRVQDVAKIGACVIDTIQSAPAGVQVEFMTSIFTGVAVCPGDASNAAALIDRAISAGGRALADGSMALTFHTDSMGRWA
ncbi:MAG: hypothetical protein KDB61_03830, partial [Planctomycetes bacterium]|nr:hypothetical protein [Planctomycetota bacterium]